MKILLLEPFFTGSHKQWTIGFQKYSTHDVEILSLPGRHWKWRMHGGAIALAEIFQKKYQNKKFDLILATDMLDLNIFLSLTRSQTAHIPTAIYFHENQLTYPWSPTDSDVEKGRDNHYAFINYTSALTADRIFFNSKYHQRSWLSHLPDFLNQFPDFKNSENVEVIKNKSEVLYLGMDLKRFDQFSNTKKENVAVLLWNHRWEYDKNPDLFFEALFRLKKENINFKLIVLGESYHKSPPIFQKAKEVFKDNIIHFGFAKDWETYAKLLWQADISPVTSNQDFFGGSVVEAMYCNCFPILPNRLAYPEHIPSEYHDLHFFKNNELDVASSADDLFKKIKNAIMDLSIIRKSNHYQNFVDKYDWSNLAHEYDQSLAKLVTS